MEINVLETKVCPYCKSEFKPNRHNQIYCKETCKVYASQVRQGRKTQYTAVATLAPPPVISLDELKAEINALRIVLDDKVNEFDELINFGIWRSGLGDKKEYLANLANEINSTNSNLSNRLGMLIPSNTENEPLKVGEMKESSKYNPIYDFTKFRCTTDGKHTNLAGLGKLKQPFIFYLFTDAQGREDFDRNDRHKFISNLASEFIKYLNSSILIIGNENSDYEHFITHISSIQSEHIFFIKSERRKDIEIAITQNPTEFLIILDAELQHIDFEFLRNLQRLNNRLSIIVTSEPKINTLFEKSNIAINPNNEATRNHDSEPFGIETKNKLPLYFNLK